MYCTECGNRLPDGARFCVMCGKPQRGKSENFRQNLCGEVGCNETATHTCTYQGCGRPLCSIHLRDLDKPIRQDYTTAKRAGIVHLGGIYCQEHANEIGKQAIWALRLNTIFGYVGAFIKGILEMFWEMLKFAVRDSFK